MTQTRGYVPRRRAASEIKLLRLELLPRGRSPCEDIGFEWSSAQPTENLSPEKAARALGVEEWAPQTVVRKRYRTLQLRYPPEQFTEKHIELRPSADLLGHAKMRLNWYWQSGLIPTFWSQVPASEKTLWDESSVEKEISPGQALRRFIEAVKEDFKVEEANPVR